MASDIVMRINEAILGLSAPGGILLCDAKAEITKLRAELAACRAESAGAVAVKPLEWEENKNAREKLCKQWIAETPFGSIWIEHKKKFWISSDGVGQWRIYHETLEHAKAAAQADYEARIRAALQPSEPDGIGDAS